VEGVWAATVVALPRARAANNITNDIERRREDAAGAVGVERVKAVIRGLSLRVK
jgi:ABC-type sulfate transport system permease component